eukprot:Lithocolla_globosa_v1_NODE_3143_length_1752_cov_34.452563.p1 type:complete len:302 gc:universal NODE_3143_length_1752_cov_34.452563:1495-590(-)
MNGVTSQIFSTKSVTLKSVSSIAKWNDTFEFRVRGPELSFLRIMLYDEKLKDKEPLGEAVFAADSLMQGYHYITLSRLQSFCRMQNEDAMLFVHISITKPLKNKLKDLVSGKTLRMKSAKSTDSFMIGPPSDSYSNMKAPPEKPPPLESHFTAPETDQTTNLKRKDSMTVMMKEMEKREEQERIRAASMEGGNNLDSQLDQFHSNISSSKNDHHRGRRRSLDDHQKSKRSTFSRKTSEGSNRKIEEKVLEKEKERKRNTFSRKASDGEKEKDTTRPRLFSNFRSSVRKKKTGFTPEESFEE